MRIHGQLTRVGGAPSFLVGREREQAILRDCLVAARNENGNLVLIGGEAGIGKTSLAEWLCREAVETGSLVLVGRCYDRTETPPYGLWLDLFGRYRAVDGLPPLPAVFTQAGALASAASQAALFAAARDFLVAVAASRPCCPEGSRARTRPLVLLLDDLHWADAASLDLLRFLSRELATVPLLLVVTWRDDEVPRQHPLYSLLPLLEREASATRIGLRPLLPDALSALVTVRYRLPADDATRLVAFLRARAEGNAFFTIQLLRALEEEAVLRRMEEGWYVGDLTRINVPMPLRQVIDARLARLGDTARQFLTVAAIIGQEVPLAAWALVADVDEETILPVIERAIETHILEETTDGPRVRFVHALIREALYEGILATRRRMQHRRIGEVLAAMPDADPDAVAYHFRQGGDARAAGWLVKAGTRARLAYAFVTAAERYEAAIALMAADPTASSEYGWAAYLLANAFFFTAPKRAIDILSTVVAEAVRRGDAALEALARYQRALIEWSYSVSLVATDDMIAAVRSLEELPATEAERMRHYLGPHYSLDDDRAGLARILYISGRFAEALPLAERLVHGEQDMRTYPYASGAETLGIVCATRGQRDEAHRWLRHAHDGLRACQMLAPRIHLDVYDILFIHMTYEADRPEAEAALLREAEEIEAEARDSGLTDFHASAMVALHILHGAWPAATAQLDALSTSPNLSLRIYITPHIAFLAWHQGDGEQVTHSIATMLPDGPATSPGSVRFHPNVMMQRLAAAFALDVGDLVTAKAWLEAHDRWLAWGGAGLGQSEGQAVWARYYRQTGDAAMAYACAQRALAHATEPRQPLALLGAHRLLGELDTAAGRLFDAAGHLDQALRLATACAAPYERALTLIALANLRAASDKRMEATRLLDEVRAICVPLGAQRALTQADELAARLAARKPFASTYPAGLTGREVEVLRLVTIGLSNPDVAERLSLSTRTVEQHLRSIYNKLGVSSRTAAARLAIAHGLSD